MAKLQVFVTPFDGPPDKRRAIVTVTRGSIIKHEVAIASQWFVEEAAALKAALDKATAALLAAEKAEVNDGDAELPKQSAALGAYHAEPGFDAWVAHAMIQHGRSWERLYRDKYSDDDIEFMEDAWNHGAVAALRRVGADYYDRAAPQALPDRERGNYDEAAEAAEAELHEVCVERDRAEKAADDMSHAIAEHFGVDIGEHSNTNDPWENALDTILSALGGAQAGDEPSHAGSFRGAP